MVGREIGIIYHENCARVVYDKKNHTRLQKDISSSRIKSSKIPLKFAKGYHKLAEHRAVMTRHPSLIHNPRIVNLTISEVRDKLYH